MESYLDDSKRRQTLVPLRRCVLQLLFTHVRRELYGQSLIKFERAYVNKFTSFFGDKEERILDSHFHFVSHDALGYHHGRREVDFYVEACFGPVGNGQKVLDVFLFNITLEIEPNIHQVPIDVYFIDGYDPLHFPYGATLVKSLLLF